MSGTMEIMLRRVSLELLEARAYETERLTSYVVTVLRTAMDAQQVTTRILAAKMRQPTSRVAQMLAFPKTLTLQNLAEMAVALGLRFDVLLSEYETAQP